MTKNPITKLFERVSTYQTREELRHPNPILDNIYNPLKDESLLGPVERRPFFDTHVRPDYRPRD